MSRCCQYDLIQKALNNDLKCKNYPKKAEHCGEEKVQDFFFKKKQRYHTGFYL